MNKARIHAVYLYLLRDCLDLEDGHRKEILKLWYGVTPETGADSVGHFNSEIDALMIRSIPSRIRQIVVIPELAKIFDYDLRLNPEDSDCKESVPGFYFDIQKQTPLNWQLNLKGKGLLRPYFDEIGRISGLFVYSDVNNKSPRLLSSLGLSLGSPAIEPLEDTERMLAA